MRYSVISLGCHKNLVDSEYLCEQIITGGGILEQDPDNADIVVVNTCSFLTSAVEESIDSLLEFISRGKQVICAGCMISRYGRDLLDELPEVALFIGPGRYAELIDAITSGQLYLSPKFDSVVSRSFCTTGASAFVKVSEGCSNHCNYCLIPSIRGELTSKPIQTVIEECRVLADGGVREIILVAQDLGSYGADTADAESLPRLLEQVALIEGISWIRLMYVHPASLTEDLVKAMRDIDKICPYIDLPIQHCSETVLKAMGRRGGSRAVKRAIDLLNSTLEDIWIRTTVMVGHPGEDETAFAEIETLISQGHFAHLGVFCFSPEQGTRSYSMKNRPNKTRAQSRRNRIMALQQDISKKRLHKLIGEEVQVLVEGIHPETDFLFIGRTAFQAPDVDGVTIITEGTVERGRLHQANITDANDYDLIGTVL
ncbi:MAG TPA: 30S ribosomal protein S12 methylthiotransferase RimO [Deltaproteobacteria bacterium]|nr:30S ribosomal protein S12 methylthiotransferase RimO [Deltaproteobacteria bacterium]